MKREKKIGLAWLFLALLLALGFSMGLGPLVQTIPWSWEKKLAAIYGGSFNKICVGSKSSEAALTKLVQRIYPLSADDQNFSINVHVLRDESINAFATLGGNLFINEGLLSAAGSAEEIAGVLAHEIEHVRQRHILQAVIVRFATAGLTSDTAHFFLHMNFTKTEEAEADSEGLARLQKSKVSPKGIYDFFKRNEKKSEYQALLSDHPSDQRRLKKLEGHLNDSAIAVLSENEWSELQKICH